VAIRPEVSSASNRIPLVPPAMAAAHGNSASKQMTAGPKALVNTFGRSVLAVTGGHPVSNYGVGVGVVVGQGFPDESTRCGKLPEVPVGVRTFGFKTTPVATFLSRLRSAGYCWLYVG